MSAPVVLLEQVTRRYGRHVVLDALDLSVGQGSVVALMGANGAGKSTLLDLVCGLAAPQAGSVQVLGRPATVAVRSGMVGTMLQSGGLLEDLTVEETAALFVELYGNRVALDELLARAGLTPVRSRRVGSCSGGERQRLRWAVAQSCRPQLLVLDEPTAGMDWEARRDFWQQVRDAAGQGTTVLYSSHYADEVELADRLVLLAGGRIVVDAAPEEVVAAAPDGGNLFAGLSHLMEHAR